MNRTKFVSSERIMTKSLPGKSIFLLMSILFSAAAHSSCPEPDELWITTKIPSEYRGPKLALIMGKLGDVQITTYKTITPMKTQISCHYKNPDKSGNLEYITKEMPAAKIDIKAQNKKDWTITSDANVESKYCVITETVTCAFDEVESSKLTSSPFGD